MDAGEGAGDAQERWEAWTRGLVGEERHTRDEVVALAGVDQELGDRLWAALGLPRTADGERAYTDDDVRALRDAVELTRRGIVDDDGLLALARSTGQLVGRLAETHVLSVRTYLDGSKEPPPADAGLDMLDRVGGLLLYVWRRQLAAAARGVLATAVPGEHVTLTVGFVDIVGYTSLSRRLEAAELGRLLEGFEARAAEVLGAAGGRVVKTVGDAVLWVADAPLPAVLGALDLVAADAGDDAPPVRAGLATGPVLPRLGDVFGPVVNLASRLCGLARPGTVLVDREAAALLRGTPGLRVSPLPRQSVRGYEHLVAARVRRTGGADSAP